MKIATDRFGEIEVGEKDVLRLPNGIIGFPNSKRFVLIDHGPDSPFRWLQSLDEPPLAFVVIDPLEIIADYPLDTLRQALAEGGEPPADIAIAAIATVPRAPSPITVNLVAPVAFNTKTRQGAQIVLSDTRFKTRHLLVKKEEEAQPATETK